MQDKIIALTPMGDEFISYKYLFTKGLNINVLDKIKIDTNDIILIKKETNQNICYPILYTLAYLRKNLDEGANIIVNVNSNCVFNSYQDFIEIILRKLGYQFTIINFNDKKRSFRKLKMLNNNINMFRFIYYLISFSVLKNIKKMICIYTKYKHIINKLSKKNNIRVLVITDNYFNDLISIYLNYGDIDIHKYYQNITPKKVEKAIRHYSAVIYINDHFCQKKIIEKLIITNLCNNKKIPFLNLSINTDKGKENIENIIKTFINSINKKEF